MKAHTTWFLRESRSAATARKLLPVLTYFTVLFGTPLVVHFIARGAA